jgi:hypothetical protein
MEKVRMGKWLHRSVASGKVQGKSWGLDIDCPGQATAYDKAVKEER